MKTVVVTQARLGSTRLPRKVLKKIFGQPLLEIHIERIKKSKLTDEIILATTTNKEDEAIAKFAEKKSIHYGRGSETDVLDRYYKILKKIKPDFVIRLTSDCPLIDGQLIDEMISLAKKKKLDYFSNTLEETFPDGQDIEIFTFNALEKAWKEATLKSDREHVTPYIKRNSTYNNKNLFTAENYRSEMNYNSVRLTVDEPQDLEVIKQIVKSLGLNESWKTYSDFYLNHPAIKNLNSNIMRNEGYYKSLNKD